MQQKRMGRHILQIDISYLDIIYLEHNICVLHMCIPTNEFGKNRVKSSELKIAEATNICWNDKVKKKTRDSLDLWKGVGMIRYDFDLSLCKPTSHFII